MADTYNGQKVIFVLTEADVKACARQLGYPEETITDDILQQVTKGVEWGLEYWSEVMMEALREAYRLNAAEDGTETRWDELELMRRLGK